MKQIRDFCSMKQRTKLIEMGKIAYEFYKDNDNTLTYALTGLLMELTEMGFNSPTYLKAKLGIIIAEMQKE